MKNHSTGVEGDRRYEWMIDVLSLPSDRFGMGRLDAVPRMCTYPNVRASGLADLAELAPLSALPEHAPERAHTLDSPRLDPVAKLHWHPEETQRTLQWIRFAGDYLFDLTLLVAYSDPGDGLSEELRALWEAAWSSATLRGSEGWLGAIVPFDRLALELTDAVRNLGPRGAIGPHNGPLGLTTLERSLHFFVATAAAALSEI